MYCEKKINYISRFFENIKNFINIFNFEDKCKNCFRHRKNENLKSLQFQINYR